MGKEEIKQLETLLEKLHSEIGQFCVIPGYLHDGFYLATYNNDGTLKHKTQGATLEDAINEINKK